MICETVNAWTTPALVLGIERSEAFFASYVSPSGIIFYAAAAPFIDKSGSTFSDSGFLGTFSTAVTKLPGDK